jgi:ATP-dependent RNA helicase DeaD
VVDTLSDDFDPVEIAMAAVRMYHQATVSDDAEKEGEAPLDAAPAAPRSPYGSGRVQDSNMAKIFIAAGRLAGIRPQDLVGAIANEAGVSGKSIGAIQITDKFSLVEIAEENAEAVIRALRDTKIKGKKVSVRLDRA